MASTVKFNVMISGVSVSGAIDVNHTQFSLKMGNTDTVGSVQFALADPTGQFSRLTVSGNAMIQVDAVRGNNVLRTMFRGTVERIENDLTYNMGLNTRVLAYDYGQELLGLLSPDGRMPSALNSNGTISVLQTSGDQGMGASQGQDLVLFVSGSNYGSGATVANFMSQFIGTQADHTGSASGQLFTFKPYFSGMAVTGANAVYRTWYYPDTGAGGDLNQNYWMPLNALKVKRQYAWDVLKKMTRQQVAIDATGNKVQFELYVGVSGDVHIFTSGSNEFFASGVVFQYYAAGASGANLNNIVAANIPLDTTILKNKIVGWFPTWTTYPLDGDSWTDLAAYSGGFWSGTNQTSFASVVLSGGPPSSDTGLISILSIGLSGTVGAGDLLTFTYFTVPGTRGGNGSGKVLNLVKFDVSESGLVGSAEGVNLTFNAFAAGSQSFTAAPTTLMTIYDLSGNYILMKNALTLPWSGWASYVVPIFTESGSFASGTWSFSSPQPDLSNVAQIQFTNAFTVQAGTNTACIMGVDNMALQFADYFSPTMIYSSGSVSVYGPRYEVFDYPYQTTDLDASGIITSELIAHQAPKQMATLTVKDNQAQPFSYQIAMTPGKVFVIDAPLLNTGSGQTFYYWRATSVEHNVDMTNGFQTTIKAYPWMSGAAGLYAASGVNIIDYMLPVLDSPAPSRRSDYLPVSFVGTYPG